MSRLLNYFYKTQEINNYKRKLSFIFYAVVKDGHGFCVEKIVLPEDKKDISYYYQFDLGKELSSLVGFLTQEEWEDFNDPFPEVVYTFEIEICKANVKRYFLHDLKIEQIEEKTLVSWKHSKYITLIYSSDNILEKYLKKVRIKDLSSLAEKKEKYAQYNLFYSREEAVNVLFEKVKPVSKYFNEAIEKLEKGLA
jgi:hypothetical protein